MFRPIRTLRTIPRFKDIALVLARHGFHQLASYLQAPVSARIRRLFTASPPPHIVPQPERLRLVLQDLGPTFIKFGQLLSTRPDLVPENFIRELEKLQDDIPPAPIEEILETITQDLGAGVEVHFREFEREPLASASIGQVHRAVTRDGEPVVVKVRKPGFERLIEQDLEVLRLLAEFMKEWSIFQVHDIGAILDAFDRSIRRELDFNYERFNMLKMRERLSADDGITIPRVFSGLSSKRVLTLEFLPGKRFSALSSGDLGDGRGEAIAERLTISLLKQIFEDGIFHADPHPGNLILMPDGRIGMIDFGNVGKCTPSMMDDLLILLYHVARQNYLKTARMIMKMGGGKAEVDVQQLAYELMDNLDQYYGLSLAEIQFAGLLNSLFAISMRHKLSLPPQYVLMGRALMILEGVVRSLAPGLEILPRVEPYLIKVVRGRWTPAKVLAEAEEAFTEIAGALRGAPVHLAEALKRIAEGRLRLDTHLQNTERIEKRLEIVGQRIPVAILAGSVLIGSSLLINQAVGSGSGLQAVLGAVGFSAALLVALRMALRS